MAATSRATDRGDNPRVICSRMNDSSARRSRRSTARRDFEANALAQYNTELANLELETGTILESHGVRFFEERYGSIGPLGRLGRGRLYPETMRPGENEPKYRNGKEPAENFFELDDPLKPKPEPEPSKKP